MIIDWNKPIVQRNGLKARDPVKFTDGEGREWVSVIIEASDGGETQRTFDVIGRYAVHRPDIDIINVPEPPAWIKAAAKELCSHPSPEDRSMENRIGIAVSIIAKHAKEAV